MVYVVPSGGCGKQCRGSAFSIEFYCCALLAPHEPSNKQLNKRLSAVQPQRPFPFPHRNLWPCITATATALYTFFLWAGVVYRACRLRWVTRVCSEVQILGILQSAAPHLIKLMVSTSPVGNKTCNPSITFVQSPPGFHSHPAKHTTIHSYAQAAGIPSKHTTNVVQTAHPKFLSILSHY